MNPLTYQFFQNSIISGTLIATLLPLIGTIVLLRRMTFVADSFGHINMAGIAFSIFISSLIPSLANFSSIITFLWTVCAAILIEYLRDKYQNYKELSIAIVYSISIALMMIFLSLSGGYNSSLFSVLFGNINGVSSNELILIAVYTFFIYLIFAFNYRKILILALEEDYSKLYNVNVKFYKYLTMILISLAISLAIKTIGVLLVSSLMIIPLLAAGNISSTLKKTTIMGVIFTELSMILGIFISFYLNLPTSALIVLVAIAIYIISIKLKKD